MTTRIHDLLAVKAASQPDHPAIRELGGQDYSYAALQDAIRRLAADLADRGLRPGDRLLILAENCAALVGLVMAASSLNAIAVPINARMTDHELHGISTHCDPRLIVYLGHVSDAARAHGAQAGAVNWATPLGDLLISAHPLAATPEAVRDDAEQIAVILYTTGTTGTPKGVMLSHANLIFGGTTSARMRNLVPGDLILGVLPMTHVFGLTSMMVGGFRPGRRCGCMRGFPRPPWSMRCRRASPSCLRCRRSTRW